MLKLATWNVNSIKARLANVCDWLVASAPDVVLLQETKTTDEAFPRSTFEELGYTVETHGQKSYNGVAILAKFPLIDVCAGLPGDAGDEQARYLEAWVDAGDDGVRVASLYLPNGNPTVSPKFAYKLAWMERLARHAGDIFAREEPAVLGGDFNVIPRDEDCADPAAWAEDALARPETRARFRTLVYAGYTEAWRALHPDDSHAYSYWDYQGGAWQRDQGVRIDHLLLTPQAADRLAACEIDKSPRGAPKASDHTPVWCELEIGV